MDENESFRSIVMYTKARALIEYCQIYLSQRSELNGKKTDFADRFEKYLSKLEPEDCMTYSICHLYVFKILILKSNKDVEWLDYMKSIDRTVLRQDVEIKNFINLLFGEKYNVLSGGIHTITKYDLELFSTSLDFSQDDMFVRDKDKWKSLVQFLSKPGRFEKCEAQKQRLMDEDKI